ncbi:uncharacterized protein SAZU_3992 [Streptomyces azureus]|uniref:Uncharacterized protein n=1 Tax=Streptomyces azureus TaxID=146537 RepID=A0A0K8PN06_STRAJ|nr:uncharacterized protein SAZU_3992 [Streptomyces azureus]
MCADAAWAAVSRKCTSTPLLTSFQKQQGKAAVSPSPMTTFPVRDAARAPERMRVRHQVRVESPAREIALAGSPLKTVGVYVPGSTPGMEK